jgi:Skp family chaperone for outer membrane proteins
MMEIPMVAKRTLLIAAVVLSLGLVGLVGAQTAAALRATPTAVATVDLQKVFEQLKEKTQLEADLRTRTEDLQQQEQDRRKTLANAQSDLDLLAPGTEAFNAKQLELEKGVIELRSWSEFENQKLNRERGLQLENLYRKSLDAIGRVAGETGYDVVLFRESDPTFRYENPQQLSTLIQVRKVLWSKDEIDLTADVIQRMNNEFENAR